MGGSGGAQRHRAGDRPRILNDPGPRQRSLFFPRGALPYKPDARGRGKLCRRLRPQAVARGVAEHDLRLKALKKLLKAEFSTHVIPYSTGGNSATGRVTGWRRSAPR